MKKASRKARGADSETYDMRVAAVVHAVMSLMTKLELDYGSALMASLTVYMNTIEAAGDAITNGRFVDEGDHATAEQLMLGDLREVGNMLHGLAQQPVKEWPAYLEACRESARLRVSGAKVN